MKLSKNLGRIATTFLATAMLAGLTAVPASAATISGGTAGDGDDQPIGSLQFDSVLWLPTGTSVPSATFTYKLNEVTDVTGETVPGYTGLNVQPSTDTVQTTPDADYVSGEAVFSSKTPASPLDDSWDAYLPEGAEVSEASVEVTIPLADLHFSDVGVYKYTLTQDLASNSADDFDLTRINSRVVYLYVANTGSKDSPNYQVTGAVLVDAGSYDLDAKSEGLIRNFYLIDGNPDNPKDPDEEITVPTSQLKISNTIAGAMGDMSDTFKFNFTIKNSDKTKVYAYQVFDKNDSAKPGMNGTATVDVAVSNIELGDGDYIVVYGISESDKFDVSQSNPDANGYDTQMNNADVYEVKEGTLVTYPTGVLAFTNTRDAIAPTGLVLNVAPYVLLVLVAAGAGYVFLRKREED